MFSIAGPKPGHGHSPIVQPNDCDLWKYTFEHAPVFFDNHVILFVVFLQTGRISGPARHIPEPSARITG